MTGNIGVGAGFSQGDTAWILDGDGPQGPLTILWGDTYSHAIEAGVDLGGIAWGYIRKSAKLNVRKQRTDIIPSEDYVVSYSMLVAPHFELGSAVVTDDGRDALRLAAAAELAAFRNKDSELIISGHADRVDTEVFNVGLSRARARNVLQALRDILGADLKIKTGRIHTFGWGEFLAKLLQKPDGTPSPGLRRVFVVLNGRVVASLRGEE